MSKRTILMLVLVAIILSGGVFLFGLKASTKTQTPAIPPVTLTPTYEGCYYIWASKDLPEVSKNFQAELQKILPEVSGTASAYGEDCVYADGHAQFGAMETDFNLVIQVKDSGDNNELGKIIETILPAFDQAGLPARIGKISIQFKSENSDRYVNFDYTAATSAFDQGLRGEELLKVLDGK